MHSAFSNALHILHCSAHHASIADWKSLHLAMQNALTGHYALQILDVHRFFTHCVMKSKTRLLFPTLLWCAQFTNSSFSPLCTIQLFSAVLWCAHVHNYYLAVFPHCIYCVHICTNSYLGGNTQRTAILIWLHWLDLFQTDRCVGLPGS